MAGVSVISSLTHHLRVPARADLHVPWWMGFAYLAILIALLVGNFYLVWRMNDLQTEIGKLQNSIGAQTTLQAPPPPAAAPAPKQPKPRSGGDEELVPLGRPTAFTR